MGPQAGAVPEAPEAIEAAKVGSVKTSWRGFLLVIEILTLPFFWDECFVFFNGFDVLSFKGFWSVLGSA